MYLVWFGQLFSRVQPLSAGAGSYTEFLAPGMAVLSAMFGSIYSGIGSLTDVDKGMFNRIVVAPVPRASIPLAYVTATLVQVVIQVVFILVVSYFLGAAAVSFSTALVVVVIATIAGTAFAALSNALAFWAKKPQIIMSLLNFVALPMMFLSNIMISFDLMPGWIRLVAKANPLSWTVSIARDAYAGTWSASSTNYLLALSAFLALCLVAMLISFRQFINSR